GTGPNSDPVSALTVPPAPGGVAAVGGDLQVTLTWNAAQSATSYVVSRGTAAAGPFAQVATVTGTSTVDTGLNPSATYFYVVTAVNSTGAGAPSTAVPALTLPAAPTGLVATGGNLSVALSW